MEIEMEEHEHLRQIPEHEAFISSFVQFRNPNIHFALVIQLIMILAAFLILLGVLYVIILLIIMGIHHIKFDNDARKIPPYVKRSIQFTTDESDDLSDHEEKVTIGTRKLSSKYDKKKSVISKEISKESDSKSSSSSSESETDWKKLRPSPSKKAIILDKFLNESRER